MEFLESRVILLIPVQTFYLFNSQAIFCFIVWETLKRETGDDFDKCFFSWSLVSGCIFFSSELWTSEAVYVCLLCAQCVGCLSVNSSWFINLHTAVELLSRLMWNRNKCVQYLTANCDSVSIAWKMYCFKVWNKNKLTFLFSVLPKVVKVYDLV